MAGKHIILVVAAYFPDSYGGAERQAQILAEALGRKGYEVTLVAPSKSLEAPENEPTAFGRVVRYRVRAYPNQGGRHIASFIAWTLWFRRRFGQAAYKGVPIYVFHARLHALGPALAAIANKAPLMLKLGGGGEASDFAALRAKKFFYGDWVQALLVKRVNSFVANGSQIVKDLEALGVPADRIAAFPNGVVLPQAEQFEQALAARRGDRFIFTGRLVPDKRVAVLYDAVMALQAPHLSLVGDGSEFERLAALPRAAADDARISLPGFVADVYPLLNQSDFFVSASMREGQSNSLLEAMSAGVIPIVYNASGVRDVIQDGVTGFVVEESTAEAFGEAMRRALALTESDRHAMARAARRFAEDNIGIDAIAARTIATLEHLKSQGV